MSTWKRSWFGLVLTNSATTGVFCSTSSFTLPKPFLAPFQRILLKSIENSTYGPTVWKKQNWNQAQLRKSTKTKQLTYLFRYPIVDGNVLFGPLEAPCTVLKRTSPRVLHSRKQASLLQQLSGVGVFEVATRSVCVKSDETTGQTEEQECGQQKTTAYRRRSRSRWLVGFGGFALLGGNFFLHLLQKRKKNTYLR